MKQKVFIVACLMACLLAGPVFGAVTGEITGTVVDAKTGEALVGVSVSIQGTTMGAKTDVDGKYIILNLPTETYTLVFSSVGYATVEVSNVHVSADLATFQDMSLTSEVTDLGKVITVRAERPLVIKDKTTSINIITADEIQAMPVRGFEDVIGLQNSVVRMKTNVDVRQRGNRESTALNAEINLRGGRPSEVAYYVDGFSQQDPLTGNSTTTLANNAIKEVTVTSGVFSAEYGHVASGIVNVVTNSGTDEYHGNLDILTDNKPGMDCWDHNYYSGDVSGPIPNLEKSYFFFSGERRWLADRSPSVKTKEIYEEYGIDTLHDKYGEMPYGYSHRLPSNWLSGWSAQGKLDFEVNPNLKLAVNGNYSLDIWRQYFHGYLYDYRHCPRTEDKNLGVNAKITHALDPETFYNLSASYFLTERVRGDGELFDDIDTYVRDYLPVNNPEWDDLDLFREWMEPITDTLTGDTIGYAESYYDQIIHRKSSYIGFKGDFNKQMFSHHTTKLGFDFQRHTLRYFEHWTPVDGYEIRTVNRFGFDSTGNESDNEDYKNETKHPINLGVYIQDRFEWRGMIINAGLRFDFFDYNTLSVKDPLNPLDPANVTGVDTLDPGDLEDSKTFTRISPRLGVAFPISDKAQFHINYGKFFQRPNLTNLFLGYDFWAARIGAGSYLPFPSPNLEPEKVTQYEAGITHQLGDNTALGITAYYKDVQDQTQIFHQPAQPYSYDYYANTDYGTIKGIDLNLTMRRMHNISLNLNYTLSWATGTGSYAETQYNVAWKAPERPPKITNPLDYDQRHSINSVIDFRTTKSEGPKIGDVYPFEDMGINVLIQASSGVPYTPTNKYDAAREGIAVSQEPTGRVNSSNMPWSLSIDLKAERKFNYAQFTFTPYIWVQNLLENENVFNVYEGTGKGDKTGWMETAEGQTWTEVYGPDAVKQYRLKENNPKNYGKPRMILVGLRMSF